MGSFPNSSTAPAAVQPGAGSRSDWQDPQAHSSLMPQLGSLPGGTDLGAERPPMGRAGTQGRPQGCSSSALAHQLSWSQERLGPGTAKSQTEGDPRGSRASVTLWQGSGGAHPPQNLQARSAEGEEADLDRKSHAQSGCTVAGSRPSPEGPGHTGPSPSPFPRGTHSKAKKRAQVPRMRKSVR